MYPVQPLSCCTALLAPALKRRLQHLCMLARLILLCSMSSHCTTANPGTAMQRLPRHLTVEMESCRSAWSWTAGVPLGVIVRSAGLVRRLMAVMKLT